MKPTKPITDPTFRYVPSVNTDIRRLFSRIRREQLAEAERIKADQIEARSKVRELLRGLG